MNPKLLPVAGLLAAAVASVAPRLVRAQIVYEPFAYPAGPLDTRVNPGNGLPWDQMTINPPAMTTSSSPPPTCRTRRWAAA
ncbi:MAG: hypothetical protein ABIP55_05735 [Tepidisphaeraceae bacterium]